MSHLRAVEISMKVPKYVQQMLRFSAHGLDTIIAYKIPLSGTSLEIIKTTTNYIEVRNTSTTDLLFGHNTESTSLRPCYFIMLSCQVKLVT